MRIGNLMCPRMQGAGVQGNTPLLMAPQMLEADMQGCKQPRVLARHPQQRPAERSEDLVFTRHQGPQKIELGKGNGRAAAPVCRAHNVNMCQMGHGGFGAHCRAVTSQYAVSAWARSTATNRDSVEA